jgi:hypothetical protein
MSHLSSWSNNQPNKKPAELCFPPAFTVISLLAIFFEPVDEGDMFL